MGLVVVKPVQKRRMARCHPDQANFGRGMCSPCYSRFRNGELKHRTGLRNLGETLQPVRRLLQGVPAVCPRLGCDNTQLTHYPGAPEVSCLICGWEDMLEPPIGPYGPLWR